MMHLSGALLFILIVVINGDGHAANGSHTRALFLDARSRQIQLRSHGSQRGGIEPGNRDEMQAADSQSTGKHPSGPAVASPAQALVHITSAELRKDDDADYWYRHDWLFGYSKTVCGSSQWDNTQYSLISRVLFPILYVCLVISIVLIGRLKEDAVDEECSHGEGIMQPCVQRRNDLDFARILCIACVVTEHSGGWHWSDHNTLFALQWVMPFLYITSGIGFMMSRKELRMYVTRLAQVLIVGVLANLAADQLTGRDWQGDFSNTIFQMFYVVMLIGLASVTAPLRQSLAWRMGNPNESAGWGPWAAVFIFGTLTAIGFALFMSAARFDSSNSDLAHNTDPHSKMAVIFSNTPLILIQVSGILFLCHIACIFKATSHLPWVLLAHIYLPHIAIPFQGVGFSHNIELFIFAMVVESWKVSGQRRIVGAVHRYWPMLIFLLLLLSCADMQGRCDLMPASTIGERFRFYGIELILCLCLSIGAFKVGDACSSKTAEWLNSWALYAYCFHVAWARIFPQPYGAVVTYTSSIFFYTWSKYQASEKLASSESSIIAKSVTT